MRLAAFWRLRPKNTVMAYSDQGTQFSSYHWRDFMAAHNMRQNMSRRGNSHDDGVPESSILLLKRERNRWNTHSTRDEAMQDIVDYIEMFYSPMFRHSFSSDMSPLKYDSKI